MDIFPHNYENVSQMDRELLESYFNGFDYKASGYAFYANLVWSKAYCLSWEVKNGLLLMAGSDCMSNPANAVCAMPLTNSGNYDKEALREAVLYAKRRFDNLDFEFTIASIPEHMVKYLEEAFPGELEITGNPDNDEYVYFKDKMMTLSGRALHKKRNHMNFFRKAYQYEARPLTGKDTDEVEELVGDFLKDRLPSSNDLESIDEEELKTLELERNAIMQCMKVVDDEDVFSVGIRVGGELVAFSLGELLSSDMAVAHFEKAKDGYRGLYQIVASEFCKLLPESVVYINREEDMGIENLRKAKEALKPEFMLRKFSARFRKK